MLMTKLRCALCLFPLSFLLLMEELYNVLKFTLFRRMHSFVTCYFSNCSCMARYENIYGGTGLVFVNKLVAFLVSSGAGEQPV